MQLIRSNCTLFSVERRRQLCSSTGTFFVVLLVKLRLKRKGWSSTLNPFYDTLAKTRSFVDRIRTRMTMVAESIVFAFTGTAIQFVKYLFAINILEVLRTGISSA